MATKKDEAMDTALVRRENNNLPAPVQGFAEVEKLGALLEKSGMFGCTQQGQGIVIAMTCAMERITPLQFRQTYHIVEGAPSMRADAMLARFLDAGGEYKILDRDSEKASVWMKCGQREGTFTLTHDDVKQEPFYWKKDGKTAKDNYASPRKRMQMLWARVTSDGVRAVAPHVVAGTYTPEEVQDFTEDDRVVRAKPVTAESVAASMTMKPTPEAAKPEVMPKQEAAPATPAESDAGSGQPLDAQDFSTVPAGNKLAGTKFDTLANEKLVQIVTNPKCPYSQGHKDFCRKLLEGRGVKVEGGAA